jgi:phenylpropionate dioxygenase-like ring-hydroxylating dioxygenase large terminal subunit
MALPPTLASRLESLREHVASGVPCWGDRATAIPVSRYTSADWWRAETQGIFRRLPLVAAHASEIAPGQVLAHDDAGVPLLLTRDADGRVRAFLNVCRHRGMRLAEAGDAQPRASLVCPYHGWTYRLDGCLRHVPHAGAFDPCPEGARDLVTLPCEERHGLVWVVADPQGTLDLDSHLAGLGDELDFLEVASQRLFRTIRADYPANWKLVIDAFLEPYHIRMLHRDTIYPFFTDGITQAQRFGAHISSLVARREAAEWAARPFEPPPADLDTLRRLASPTQVIFPNTVTIFHPDYLSLITVHPTAPDALRWTHRMLIPADRSTPDWTPHWEKSFRLIEQGVFEKEDIRCAVDIQKGLASGANTHLTAGRMELALAWFHDSVAGHIDSFLPQGNEEMP